MGDIDLSNINLQNAGSSPNSITRLVDNINNNELTAHRANILLVIFYKTKFNNINEASLDSQLEHSISKLKPLYLEKIKNELGTTDDDVKQKIKEIVLQNDPDVEKVIKVLSNDNLAAFKALSKTQAKDFYLALSKKVIDNSIRSAPPAPPDDATPAPRDGAGRGRRTSAFKPRTKHIRRKHNMKSTQKRLRF